ncbi:MAG TPA: hypothetical protein VFA84_05170 [Acidimicrobiales bacterium]|nr:hypothetical protein [Acidimicrobiales bacterium]
MADIPPEGPARPDLAHVRAQLTSLVERRLTFGLTPDEEAEYRRLTELERELLREPGALADERDDPPGPAGT